MPESNRVRLLRDTAGTEDGEQAPQIAHDRALARRVLRGDRRATVELCDTHLPRLYRFALHRLPSAADADDVVQVVIGTAARRIETFRGQSTLYAWLLGICRREISKHLAAAGRRAGARSLQDQEVADQVALLPGPDSEEPEVVVGHVELAGRVQACLAVLPERQAAALELKYVDGFSSKEIATRLGISDEATQSLLARARRTFREVFDGELLIDMDGLNGRG